MRPPVLIAFGSNIDPLENLERGLKQLHERIPIEALSSVWRTPPLPNPNPQGAPPALDPVSEGDNSLSERGPADFLNGALLCRSDLPPLPLRQLLREIEAACHRQRRPDRYAPRTLDLDIALMGRQVLRAEKLILPDPDIPSRPFLALPLAELAGEMIHPLEGCTLSELAARFGPEPVDMTLDQKATKRLRAIVSHR
ncbi:MAG: 2-amino-4-hydroxy-6-hydroxymethyldihydropteridine diphosphokinase [Magnetococcales bacterium]|nr:2-amino-4-hydroxy-6-hydroxymethyldihydropteridine diphosphokinase [Magnetococcales bacterium]